MKESSDSRSYFILEVTPLDKADCNVNFKLVNFI